MLTNRTLSAFLFASFAAIAFGTPAEAQALRTWVSGLGNDANPCSLTAPCKTFAGAISKTATGGEIDALDPGGYGTLTITKSLTIDGGAGQVASVLASGTPGFIVNSAGAVVVLRNISINGVLSGNIGINVLNAARVSVENCNIQGFTTYGIGFQPSAAGTRLFVSNSQIHDNAGYGVVALPPSAGAVSFVTLDGDNIFHNGVGVFVGDNAAVQATRTAISQNGSGATISTSVAAAFLRLDDSSVSNNAGNGLFLTASGGHAIVDLSNSQITGNTGASMVIPAINASVVSFGNNRILDNSPDTLPNNQTLLH